MDLRHLRYFLAVAEELQLMRTASAIEVRPVREEPLADA